MNSDRCSPDLNLFFLDQGISKVWHGVEGPINNRKHAMAMTITNAEA